MDKKSIGEKISELRNKMNITQKELGNAVGISSTSIAMYELNERIPRDEIKKRIAAYFNVSVQDLFF